MSQTPPQTTTPENSAPDTAHEKLNLRFLTEADVCDRTTLGRATIWRKIKDGSFPSQVKISDNRVAWYEHEVNEWMLAHMNAAEPSS